MKKQNIPAILEPLVRRHAEDAAFYWAQHDASAESPRLDLSGLARFSQLLAAHLEGLEVAGREGWPLCLEALERWKKPAEAFVAAHTALRVADAVQREALLVQIRARPDELLRGVISALAWIPLEQALPVIKEWAGAAGDAVMQVAALRAVALIGADAFAAIEQPLEGFIDGSDEHVRAAACRVAAHYASAEPISAVLLVRLQDPALAVRAEAAIALSGGRMSDSRNGHGDVQVALALTDCVAAQVAVLNAATGWYRKQALRRLNRWVKHLGALQPDGLDCSGLLEMLPPRLALRFIAYRGDSAYLPYVVKQMSIPGEPRYAGWVWQTITGVNLSAAGLSFPEPARDVEADDIQDVSADADLGLVIPDAEAIKRFPTNLVGGQRYLLGLALNPTNALAALRTASQAHRDIAACYLELNHPPIRISIRAPLRRQISSLDQIQALLEMETAQ